MLFVRGDRRTHLGWLVAALLILFEIWIIAAKPRIFRLGGRHTLRVAAAESEIVRSHLSPYGKGFEHDLVAAFCADKGLVPEWKFVDSWEQGWQMLNDGEADVLIGPGLTPPENMTDTVWGGPRYSASEVLILNNEARWPLQDPAQLCDTPFLVQNVQSLPDLLAAWLQPQGCAAAPSWTVSPGLMELLQKMEGDAARFAVADARLFQLWQPFYAEVQPGRRTGKRIFRRWFWQKDSEHDGALKDFWRERGKAVASELNALYLGFLPYNFDYYEGEQLRQVLRDNLPLYTKTIIKAAQKYRLDPLFLAAVIYQESNFDRHAVSPTGVQGIMQLSQATADDLGVRDRTDPHQSIMGGAKHLRELYDSLEEYGFTPWNRWFVALAAYNQGVGRTRDALALAEEMDMGSKWRSVRKALRLLGKSRSRRAEAAYSGRTQAAVFVRNIRFWYYILKGLSVLPGSEAEELAPFTAAVPPGWPG